MSIIKATLAKYTDSIIDKPTFIKSMSEKHHAALFDYAEYLQLTNIKRITIEDGQVIMTSRDRGILFVIPQGDFRIAPIETLNFLTTKKLNQL